MAKARVMCFHKRRRCGFCGIPRPAVGRVRRRCACCGRFVKVTWRKPSCPVCMSRGYEALALFTGFGPTRGDQRVQSGVEHSGPAPVPIGGAPGGCSA